jgi:hypothetical protein
MGLRPPTRSTSNRICFGETAADAGDHGNRWFSSAVHCRTGAAVWGGTEWKGGEVQNLCSVPMDFYDFSIFLIGVAADFR